jgi:hypothetical protein
MERIPASERTREKLKAVIEGSGEGGGTSELVRLAKAANKQISVIPGEQSLKPRAAGPRVCRLPAGGKRIRTHGPTPNGTEMGGRRHPSASSCETSELKAPPSLSFLISLRTRGT